MAVFKVNKTKDYTVMSNYHLRDKNLSLKAKGLLSIMLSLPEEWDYSISGLASLGKEKKDAIITALNELEEYKYLDRENKRNEKGQFETIYNIYEMPNMENRYGKSETGNQLQYNTNILNTNIKEKNIEKEQEIFDFWNSLEIIKHKELTDDILKQIKKCLKDYSVEEIKTYISRYNEVIKCKNYFFNTKWTLKEFLKQSNAMPDFKDDGSKWVNFKNKNVSRETNFKQRDYNEKEIDGLFTDIDKIDF